MGACGSFGTAFLPRGRTGLPVLVGWMHQVHSRIQDFMISERHGSTRLMTIYAGLRCALADTLRIRRRNEPKLIRRKKIVLFHEKNSKT